MKKTLFAAFFLMAFYCTEAQTSAAQTKESKQSSSEAVTVDTGTGTLYGTLLVPAAKTPMPVVLIIAGSGPTDRDGNSAMLPGPNNSLKMLAEGLAASGIASLRYDKRGIAESGKTLGNPTDLRFDFYVNDAEMWAKKLRADKRFSTLTIAGHSEGSLIGMIAAKNVRADGYISLAGSGRAANLILHDQFKDQLPPELQKRGDEILASLAAGKTVDSYPQELITVFHPTLQPYMISWFKFDPAKEIAKLTVPVMVVQGTSDAQVAVENAKQLSKAAPEAKLVMIDGMNHVLKQVGASDDLQKRSYTDPSIPIETKLVAEIVGFVKKIVATK